MDTEQLRKKVAVGSAVLVLLRVLIRVIGLISTMVLFRLLAPDDFGVVALATLILGFFEVISEISLDQALVRKSHPTTDDYNLVWSLNALRGVVCAVLMWAWSGPASQFLHEPRLQPLLWALTLAPLLDGLANPALIQFSRDLEFGAEFRMKVGQKLIGFFCTLGCALWWENYWALVVGILASKGFQLVAGYALKPYRPRFHLTGASQYFGFSGWMLANHITLYAGNQSDKLLIQRHGDAAAVGLFRVAEEICTVILEFIWPIERALYPAYVKLKDEADRLRAAVLEGTAFISTLGLPMSLGLALVAEPAVLTLLGPKALPAVPFVQVLVLHGALRAAAAGLFPAFVALNKPQVNTTITMVAVAVRLTVLISTFPVLGMMAAAWSMLAGSVCTFGMVWWMGGRHLGLRLGHAVEALWRPVGAGLGMAAALAAWQTWVQPRSALHDSWQALGVLLPLLLLGALSYGLTLAALWWAAGCPQGPEARVLGLLRQRWQRPAAPRVVG